MCVAWPYLSPVQKSSFKEQARKIVSALLTIKKAPQYVIPDPDPVTNKAISREEYGILFSERNSELGFSHNDLQPSNIIVKNDAIVGVVDWEMSGFFGNRAAEVHRKLRCPGKETFAGLNLSDEKIEDLTFWSDLYY